MQILPYLIFQSQKALKGRYGKSASNGEHLKSSTPLTPEARGKRRRASAGFVINFSQERSQPSRSWDEK
jgi:hypothetical protein